MKEIKNQIEKIKRIKVQKMALFFFAWFANFEGDNVHERETLKTKSALVVVSSFSLKLMEI